MSEEGVEPSNREAADFESAVFTVSPLRQKSTPTGNRTLATSVKGLRARPLHHRGKVLQWTQKDLNLRPFAYQTNALTGLSYVSMMRGSGCESDSTSTKEGCVPHLHYRASGNTGIRTQDTTIFSRMLYQSELCCLISS